jgi:TetR/AcrR family transcriptional regulator, transcriptional repressor for nem operon
MAINQTAQKILTVAQKNIQTKGFNGFSYRDLAMEIGIKTSSIHYYFPSKNDLALALVMAHREAFNLELEKILSSGGDERSQLAAYVELFANNLAVDNKFCLCGMLASEINSLSSQVRQAIQGFFEDNERWLSQLIANGQAKSKFKITSSPNLVAAQLLATLEGAMLIARLAEQDNVAKFQQIAKSAMLNLG